MLPIKTEVKILRAIIDFEKHFYYQFVVKTRKLNFKKALILLGITKIDVEKVISITDLLRPMLEFFFMIIHKWFYSWAIINLSFNGFLLVYYYLYVVFIGENVIEYASLLLIII